MSFYAGTNIQWSDFDLPLPVHQKELTTINIDRHITGDDRHVVTICFDVKAVLIRQQNGEH